jgi:DNA polymerase III subunit gamma/tau
LFVGTRGTGKTSLARIFARAINCFNTDHVKEHGEPCNECESCQLSLKGSNIDIIEMDAASNRGIDEVRNLKESVDFLPSIGRYKVYIIDEAHMMTKEAFNALLKTIEEPPKHIVFMMCTTELFKVPATIASRSQVFELKHASIEEIVAKIDVILANEQTNIDEEGKKLIAKLGRGSFRDTESILEKVITSVSKEIMTLDDVIAILGMSSVLLIENTKNAIYKRELSEVQRILEHELDEGMIANFNYQLAESIYEDIISGLTGDKQADPFTYAVFEFLTSIDKDLRNTINPKLLYIAKILHFMKSSEAPVVSQQVQISTSPAAVEQAPVVSVPAAPTPEELEKMQHNPSAMLRMRKAATAAARPASSNQEAASDEPVRTKFVSKMDFLNFVKEKNSFLFRFFSHHEFQIKESSLVVEVKNQMERDLLMKPQTLDLIKSFGDQHGMNLKVEFGGVQVDKQSAEEQQVKQISKKVEDLDDGEIEEIFN